MSSALPALQTPATELTIEAFSDFLLSQDNTPLSESSTEIWQDMSQPISSYYISSSHNTYLVGYQLVGVSTVEGYIRALLHSCRSVECACLVPVS
jgi:phosphatidylinositol phospholipase C, delta